MCNPRGGLIVQMYRILSRWSSDTGAIPQYLFQVMIAKGCVVMRQCGLWYIVLYCERERDLDA